MISTKRQRLPKFLLLCCHFLLLATGVLSHVNIAAVQDGGGQSIDNQEQHQKQNQHQKQQQTQRIDPDVRRHSNVLPPEVCQQLVELAKETVFALDREPVDDIEDDVGDQQINVLGSDNILHQGFYDILEPYLERIANLVHQHTDPELGKLLFPDNVKENRRPALHGIFVRKYAPVSPESARDSLSIHNDMNLHTVNIGLNEEFAGGGLFYLNPLLTDVKWLHHKSYAQFYADLDDSDHDATNVQRTLSDRISKHQISPLDLPQIRKYRHSYDFLRSIQPQQNTSEIIFPKQLAGDAIVHNYTVWHAVSPITSGARFSVIFFFDEDNPIMTDDDDDDDDEEDENVDKHGHDYIDWDDDDDEWDDDVELNSLEIDVFVRHAIQKCNPETGRLVLMEDDIDVVWVGQASILEKIIGDLELYNDYEDGIIRSSPGHSFYAFRSLQPGESLLPYQKREILDSIVIQKNQTKYEFRGSVTKEECWKKYHEAKHSMKEENDNTNFDFRSYHQLYDI